MKKHTIAFLVFTAQSIFGNCFAADLPELLSQLTQAITNENSIPKQVCDALPSSFPHQVTEEIHEICDAPTFSPVNSPDSYDYGINFPMNPFRIKILEDIKQRASNISTDQQISVFHFGCKSNGTFTALTALAGCPKSSKNAQVKVYASDFYKPNAIELRQSTGKIMRQIRAKARSADYQLPPNKDLFSFSIADMRTFTTSKTFKGKQCDVLTALNAIHFLTEKGLDSFLTQCSKALKTGGSLYLSCQAPSSNKGIVDFYFDKLQKGSTFPGYMQLDSVSFWRYSIENDCKPTRIRGGSYRGNPKNITNKNHLPGKIISNFTNFPQVEATDTDFVREIQRAP